MLRVVLAATIMLACSSPPPCAPATPHDGGACGQTFDVEYDPATQTGCSFSGGAGTAETCASLCGMTATCELVTFTTVECAPACGD